MIKFVQDIAESIIQKIIRYVHDDGSLGHIPQPLFIVGSSGAGKTSMITMLTTALKSKSYDGNIMTFDGRQFFDTADIIRAIENDNDNGKTESRPKRNIVIIDDVDYYLTRSSFDDQYRLRNYLNRENSPLLIGTISRVGESLTDYDAPFFEGVRLVYIPPVDNLLLAETDIPSETYDRLTSLLEYLPPVVRSYKVASDIVGVSDSADTDLRELLYRYSPIYRERIDRLPVYSQKILFELANAEKPVNLSELRDLTNLPAGTLSTYLRQLVNTGIIKKIDPDKRGTPYEIRDNLFKKWLSSYTPR